MTIRRLAESNRPETSRRRTFIRTGVRVGCTLLVIWGSGRAFGQINNDYWNGLANNGLWSDPGNWSLGVPTAADTVYLAASNGWSTITITNGVVGFGNLIYGPEWGATLNIYGSLDYGWAMAPIQNNPTPGNRSIINLYKGSLLQCDSGAGLGLGDQWWFLGGPYVTLNMYGDAVVNMTNGAGLYLGGHLNIYDAASFSIGSGGYVDMDTGGMVNDGTRSINLGGGTLLLPTGWTHSGTAGENSGTVYDWISRGILRAYGKGRDTNDLLITDNGTNTIVTTVRLGGSLQCVYMQPLLLNPMEAGSFQRVTLVGDYPSVNGVIVSSEEPGVDPATLPGAVTFTSSNPKVATVDANGVVAAIAPGTTTLSASLGPFTSTNSVQVVVMPVAGTLIHRYSFNEMSGTDATDSVGGPAWDATLMGSTAFDGTGQVVLDGNDTNYVRLPAGILTNLNEVTIEVWASFGMTTNAWADLFAFGFTDKSPASTFYGEGGNYVTFQPHTAAGYAQATFGMGIPGNTAEQDAITTNALDGQNNMQVVVVYCPETGAQSFYTNGVLAATIPMFNVLTDPVAFRAAYANGSVLAFMLGADPDNYIGHSLYAADPGFLGSVDEFRIYDGPLTESQIAADYALGPNQLRGTNTNVSLSVMQSGGDLTFMWSTSSALVTLMSSPTLGRNAVWTPVAGSLTVSGGNYRMTIPVSNSAQFFRLED